MNMSKKKLPIETAIARLKTKIADAPLRSLRKRLKRLQRKKRAWAMRLAHAQGKKSPPKPAAAAG